MSETKGQAVLVTTANRGVFFGNLVGEASKEKVLLTNLRNCIYWTAESEGFLGLASAGPGKGCKIGAAVPGQSTLWDITGVYTCTDEAAKRWEDARWAK